SGKIHRRTGSALETRAASARLVRTSVGTMKNPVQSLSNSLKKRAEPQNGAVTKNPIKVMGPRKIRMKRSVEELGPTGKPLGIQRLETSDMRKADSLPTSGRGTGNLFV